MNDKVTVVVLKDIPEAFISKEDEWCARFVMPVSGANFSYVIHISHDMCKAPFIVDTKKIPAYGGMLYAGKPVYDLILRADENYLVDKVFVREEGKKEIPTQKFLMSGTLLAGIWETTCKKHDQIANRIVANKKNIVLNDASATVIKRPYYEAKEMEWPEDFKDHGSQIFWIITKYVPYVKQMHFKCFHCGYKLIGFDVTTETVGKLELPDDCPNCKRKMYVDTVYTYNEANLVRDSKGAEE